ncbi:MAG: P-loop NTPase [Eubacteriales bacterium]|nr:P-loop NTPase [Eubacteriales bacterium]
MKITICGKGGCGKSTVTALLAKELARRGKNVVVVDSDESNYGLHRQLGVELPRDFTEYFGGKDKAFKTMMTGELLGTVKLSAFAKKFFSSPFGIDEIPEEYYNEKDGVKLISGGKIRVADEGCACTMNSIVKQFIEHLTLGDDDVALLDMEAGVEHFGRGTDDPVDAVIMIVDPSYESLRLSEKIAGLASSLGKPVYFFLNKLTDETEKTVEATVGKSGRIIGRMKASDAIASKGLKGEELTEARPEIAAFADELTALTA